MQRLLNSAKFWTAIVDLLASLIIYFAAKYAAPAVADDVIYFIAAMQPVFLLIIKGIYEEDKAKLNNSQVPGPQ